MIIDKLRGILRARRAPLVSLGRAYTTDAQAIQFRMPAGFVGDVNRTHPVSIEAASADPNTPPTVWGAPGVIDSVTHKFRKLAAGDSGLTDIYGILCRAFPEQVQSTVNYGAAVIGGDGPNNANKLDILKSGYIMVQLNTGSPAAAKGGLVFIWVAATAAGHVQGQFEAAASGGSTLAIAAGQAYFNGPADAIGVVELAFHA